MDTEMYTAVTTDRHSNPLDLVYFNDALFYSVLEGDNQAVTCQ